MSKLLNVCAVNFLAILLIVGCSSGSSSSPAPTPQPVQSTLSTITGSATKSAISGAEIKVFRFDESGSLIEILADNAPVMTASDGAFGFSVNASDISSSTGPLLLTTTGGTMNLEDAPQLAGLIADPSILGTAGTSMQHYLTVASSVVAGVVQRNVLSSGAAPTAADVDVIMSKVASALNVDFMVNPGDEHSGSAFLNHSVDANLNLLSMPQNNPAVNDLIQYLVLNFSSASGRFDPNMTNPADDADKSFPATFTGVGTGTLANLVPGGPTSFVFFNASCDKTSIENDGFDTALVTASFMDAVGQATGNGEYTSVHTTAGRLVISKNEPMVVNGKANSHVSSVWAGDAEVTVGKALPVGTSVMHSFALAVSDDVADVEDSIQPRVVSAGSTGNTVVLVTFTEAMLGGMEGAENPAHYRIAATEPLASDPEGIDKGDGITTAEKPEIILENAQLILPDRRTVRLTTFSQSDLEYELRVTNVTDLAGNTLAPPDGSVDPSTAVFQGTPPSGDEVVDTDGDGLSDSDEQRGWIVTTITAAGVTLTFEVTSDPTNPDTDGDGISDGDEFQGGMNPRTADSDGDTLTDFQEWNIVLSDALNQDTDGDGLEDGIEFNTFRTSPTLADTDGDQLLDPDEVAAGNRNPLVADLPSPRIRVGNVNLALDTRFTFTDESGSTVSDVKGVESTLSRSENETFSTSNEDSTKMTLEFSQEIEAGWGDGSWPGGPKFAVTAGSKQGSERGNTFTVGEESGRASEETYNNSLTISTQRDIRKSVTREVVDGAIKIDLSIENLGSLPFTIRNLELSAQTQNPRNRRLVIPIASLVPENPDLDSINIGALGDSARGPFVFKTVSVFPQQVEELLKSPRGLVVRLANFDITDEAGRNFAFTSRDVLDRTAGITFDLGDGRVESYRVATASAHEVGSGRPLGITMAYALDEIIGFNSTPTIRDGGNGIVDTLAMGDDLQVAAVGSTVEPGAVVVSAGPDGVLNTSGFATPDDYEIEADYATTAKIPTGERILTRFRDVETGFEDNPATTVIDETKLFWVLYASKSLPNVDLDKIVLHAGDQFNFTFVQDQDDDGVWAREEFLHGSSDLLVDTDNDGLTDAEEIQEGWLVQIRGSREALRVYPNPVTGDSDRDMLADLFERSCGIDPRQRDTDLDGLTDWEELYGMRDEESGPFPMVIRDAITSAIIAGVPQYSGAVILDGGDAVNGSVLVGDDVFVFNGLSGGVIIEAGPNRTIESVVGGDDFRATPHLPYGDCNVDLGIIGYATDPLNDDTDGDTITDLAELELGINPNNSEDGPLMIDDDGDGVPNLIEDIGFNALINGVLTPVNSNKNVTDTDGDGLSDLLEHYLGSNPQAKDTDEDGILDNKEYNGAQTCITKVRSRTANDPCTPFDNKAYDNHGDYVSDCERADICFVDDTPFTLNPGTNLNERDSDYDSVFDAVELFDSLSITIDGAPTTLPAPASYALVTNSDADGWDDGIERNRFSPTNPLKADTDGDDGIGDDEEWLKGRNPNVKDAVVEFSYDRLVIVGDCDLLSVGDFRWSLNYETKYGGPYMYAGQDAEYSVDGSATINVNNGFRRFVLNYGDTLRLEGFLQEIDTFGADGTLSWDQTYELPTTLYSQSPLFSASDPCGGAEWDVEATIWVNR